MCAHPNPGRTRFAAEELLRRLFQFASVVYLMTGRNKHSVLHQFVHHLAEMPSETQKTFISPGKGEQEHCRDSQVTSCSIAQTGASVLCSGSKTEELDQQQKRFLSPGLPLQPQDPKTSLLSLFGAPQWCRLTSGCCYLSLEEFLLQF